MNITNSTKRKTLLAGLVGVFAAGGMTQATAQGGEAATGQSAIDEIVVTAQKRGEQNLMDVPISMSVLSGDDLDSGRYEGVAEALSQVAGVTLFTADQNGGSKLSVRGVTSGGSLFFGSGAIGYYLDEVPFAFVRSAVVPDANAYDMERVEALRGPQGTLYGSSALNGVVRILTKDANLEEYEFKARTGLSSTDGGEENFRGDFAVNVPLIPGKLAARIVAGHNDLSGWIDSPIAEKTNDSELSNFRLKVNAQPTDQLALEFSAWLSRNDYGAPSIAGDDGESTSIFEEPIAVDYDVYGITVDYDFESFSLLSSTSYIDYTSAGQRDFRDFGLDTLFTDLNAKILTQEVRLTSTSEGDWQWSLGGFYRDAEEPLVQDLPLFLPVPVAFTDESQSFAIFGEVTRKFDDGNFDLTVGLRYFEDEVTNREIVNFTGTGPLVESKAEFDTVTPRVVLNWHPSDNLTVYGSYSQGFRSGFPQHSIVITTVPDFPPVEEDTLENFEIGVKGTLFDGSMNFDTALYYINWDDVQQNVIVGLVAAPINGGSASGMGLDFSLSAKPSENFEAGVNFSWNDLTIDEDVTSGGVLLFEKGDRLDDSAEYTVGLSADYSFPLGDSGLRGQLSGSINYHSELVAQTIDGGALFIGEGDDITNARISFAVDSTNNWTVTAYIDNATNEDGATQASPLSAVAKARLRPRTAGLQFEYRY